MLSWTNTPQWRTCKTCKPSINTGVLLGIKDVIQLLIVPLSASTWRGWLFPKSAFTNQCCFVPKSVHGSSLGEQPCFKGTRIRFTYVLVNFIMESFNITIYLTIKFLPKLPGTFDFLCFIKEYSGSLTTKLCASSTTYPWISKGAIRKLTMGISNPFPVLIEMNLPSFEFLPIFSWKKEKVMDEIWDLPFKRQENPWWFLLFLSTFLFMYRAMINLNSLYSI